MVNSDEKREDYIISLPKIYLQNSICFLPCAVVNCTG